MPNGKKPKSLDDVLAQIGGAAVAAAAEPELPAVLSPTAAPGGIPAAPAGVRVKLPDIEAGRISRAATAAAASVPSLDAVLKAIVSSSPGVQAGAAVVKGVGDFAGFARTGVPPAPPDRVAAVESLIGPVSEISGRIGSGDVAGGIGQGIGVAAQAVALGAAGKGAMRRAAPAGPGLGDVLTRIREWRPSWAGAMDVFKAGERVRLPAMVSNLGTAVRNALSQAGTYSANIVDEVIGGTVKAARGTPLRAAFAPAAEAVAAPARAATASGRARMKALREAVPEQAKALTEAPAGDVSMTDRVATTLGFFNNQQEKFWRRLVFDSHVRGELKAKGLTPETAPKELLVGAAERGVQKALELTLAKQPAAGTLGNAVLGAYEKFPLLRLVQPFPKFAAASMDFVFRHSPASFFSPKLWGELAAGNPARFAQATQGTALLAATTAYRARKDADARWFIVNLPDGKQADIRPFAPFSTVMFLGEVVNDIARMNRGEQPRLTGKDYAAVSAGLNRISGSGLSIVDALLEQRNSLEKAGTAALQTAGGYVGGYLAPLAQFQAAVAQFSEAERKVRDTSDSPFWGTALRSVPGALRSFPPVPAVTRPGDLQRENPLLGQVTGLNLRSRTPVEQELERLNIPRWQIAPRGPQRGGQGDVPTIMSETLPGELRELISTPTYKRLSDAEKRAALVDLIRDVRSDARKRAGG